MNYWRAGLAVKKRKWQAVKIAAVYAGAVLGAGFASGQELMVFFVRYGVRGLWGSALAGVFFALLGALLLSRAKELKDKSFKSYLINIYGKKPAKGFYFIVELFLAVSFCIMLSGSGALFQEQFHLPPVVGVAVTALICFLVLQGNLKGLTAINLMLVPFMIAGMVFTCVGYLIAQHREIWLPLSIGDGRFFLSVFLYVSFNMITASAVLVPLSRLADTKKTAACGGLLGGLALMMAAVLACVALYAAFAAPDGSQLPLLAVSRGLGTAWSWVYSLVLYMAMLTTAAANGFSVVEHFVGKGRNRRLSAAILCIAAIPASLIPFSRLVESCYTFFGILGLALLCGIVYDWFRN